MNMAKKDFKIYLEESDYQKLIQKAQECGYSGRGALSHFLTYLAQNKIIFLDKNVKAILKALDLS